MDHQGELGRSMLAGYVHERLRSDEMVTFATRLLIGSIVLLLSASITLATTGEGDTELTQFDFWGFSIAPEPAVPGEKLELVGVVNPTTTYMPLELDFEGNEYTVHVYELTLEEVIPNGPLLEFHFSGGIADIFEDPSFNAPFQSNTNPDEVPDLNPAVVPRHFVDGVLLVRYTFRDFISLFYEPAGIGSIAYTATELRAVGGSAYPELHALHRTVGWHMGGGFTNDGAAYIPVGYGMRYDTLFRWENPLPVQETTWGQIKSAFK